MDGIPFTNDLLPSNTSQVSLAGDVPDKSGLFVVVSQRDAWSLCLRIHTYGRQACTKIGIKRSEHAIIHTSTKPPKPLPGESGMLTPIRMLAHSPNAKLDPLSRVDLGKLYTVEHKVKVYDFGQVHRNSMQSFIGSWNTVCKQVQKDHYENYNISDETDDTSDHRSAMTLPTSNQAMHTVLVAQYAVYLHENTDNEALVNALLGGNYNDQIKIYTTLMERGILPEAQQHKALVSHYTQVCRDSGQQLKFHHTQLERGSDEKQAITYAGLIKAGYALPTDDLPLAQASSSNVEPFYHVFHHTRGVSSSAGIASASEDSGVRILSSRPKPQCWDHGCNGRQFSTFSNLLRHQREKSGTAAKSPDHGKAAFQPLLRHGETAFAATGPSAYTARTLKRGTSKGEDLGTGYLSSQRNTGRESDWRRLLKETLLQDLDELESAMDIYDLSALLEHFAVRLGSQGDRDHWSMMFVVYQVSK